MQQKTVPPTATATAAAAPRCAPARAALSARAAIMERAWQVHANLEQSGTGMRHVHEHEQPRERKRRRRLSKQRESELAVIEWLSGSRRRDCHFDDTPSPYLLKHLMQEERGAAAQNDSLADGCSPMSKMA